MALSRILQRALAPNVSSNGPAFVATVNVQTSVSASTQTKIICGTEAYDTHGCYDTSNGRFTPNVPGFYYFQGSCTFGSTAWGSNGGASARVLSSNGQGIYNEYAIPNNSNWTSIQASGLFYMNGTTDYVEFFVSSSVNSIVTQYGGYGKFFGYLVRAA